MICKSNSNSDYDGTSAFLVFFPKKTRTLMPLRALKFDNFSELQNVISDSSPLPIPQCHCDTLRTKIDMWFTPEGLILGLWICFNLLKNLIVLSTDLAKCIFNWEGFYIVRFAWTLLSFTIFIFNWKRFCI